MTDDTHLDTIKNREYRMGENSDVASWDVIYEKIVPS